MNVLMVDDEIDILNEIDYYIKSYKGVDSSIRCTNALEALDEAEKTHFDIAFLDIEMPVMNGLELAERLINLFPDIRIAFITAYNHYATEAFDVNAIDYVLKPIREERLFKALDRFMGEKANMLQSKKYNHKLYIQTFEKLVVKIGDEVIKWNRQKSSEIFAYLLENVGTPVRKEKLCDLLWPDLDTKKALVNLQTTIHSIRKAFGDYNSVEISIEYSGNNYTLNLKNACIDIVEFENAIQKSIEFNDTTFLEYAVRIYKGEYLDEEGWIWAEPRKEALRKKYVFASNRFKKEHIRNKK